MKVCHQCGAEWTRTGQPGFKETCPGCESFLHACLNCKHYNPSADRCSSITAECTGARDGLNYCEEFQFRDRPNNTHHRNGSARNGSTGNVRANGTTVDGTSGNARRKFDELFGK